MPRKPPGLKLQISASNGTPKLPSFKLTDTGTFSATTGKHGSFKLTLNTSGGFASPLAKREFPGLTLDQIEPLHELGAGAGGTVRLARHRPTGRLLALKIMHVASNAREQRHAFLNELRVLCKLNHANLVPMYDCFQLEGTAYLALKYMDGGSLESCCAKYSRLAKEAGRTALGLPEPVLASVVLQCLCGLAHLHARSMMHRDLKPANVLVDTATGVSALADFGLAAETAEESHGMSKTFVGTAAYMAPERLNGQVYSVSADLWSLGMIGLECAMGQHPYAHATSYYDLVVGLSECEHPPRLPADGSFSPDLCEMTSACLAPKADDRPSSRELLTHVFFMRALDIDSGQSGGDSSGQSSGELSGGARSAEGADTADAMPADFGGTAASDAATEIAQAIVQIGESAPPPPEHCAMLAASILCAWLVSAGLVEPSKAAAAAEAAAHAAAIEQQAAHAVRIQSLLRGSQVRRELEEMRALEVELASAL